MPRYVLTDLAKPDIRDIVGYIRQRNPEAARKARLELRQAMQRLAEFPYMGHLREDLTSEPLQFWTVYSYLIAYRPDETSLTIIRIVHGARDLGLLFRSD
jgi:plasmid stabilization system protein ParE